MLWQTWAVPMLTRGCVWLGTLLCSSGCKLLPEPLPLLDPEAVASGILKCLLKAAAPPALGAQRGSRFPVFCLFL